MASPPQAKAMPVACSATGTKLFSPALTAEDACRRFVAAFGKASGRAVMAAPAGGAGLTVALKFLPQGVASASVQRAGAPAPVRHELAVSDRGFTPADIDRLAADVAQGMAKR